MAVIRYGDLPHEPAPPSTNKIATDGLTTTYSTIEEFVNAGRPWASQAEAEAGVSQVVDMNPLRVAQAITAQGATQFATAGALAAVRVPPGGTINQVLAKASATDNDTTWSTVVTAAGISDNNDMSVDPTKLPLRQNIAGWADSKTLAGVYPTPASLNDANRYADSGNHAPNLMRNFVWKCQLAIFQSGNDDPRFFGGDSQWYDQSLSRTVNGANVSQLAGGPYAAGATTITTTGIGAPVPLVGGTVVLFLDQVSGGANEIHEARITGVSGSDISFTPAIPSGKTMTVSAIAQLWRVAWSRATSCTAQVSSGSTVQTKSFCGIVTPGEAMRIRYSDGTYFMGTVASWTNTSITANETFTKTILAGELVMIGTTDVTPDFTVDHGGMPGVPGDICGNYRLTARDKTGGGWPIFRFISYIVNPDLSGGLGSVDTRIEVPDGTTGRNYLTTWFFRRGFMGVGMTSDPGLGGLNAKALIVNDGATMSMMRKFSQSMNFGTLSAGTGLTGNITVSAPALAVGDDLNLTLGATHAGADGILWRIWVSSGTQINVRAFNPTAGSVVVGTDTVTVTQRRLT